MGDDNVANGDFEDLERTMRDQQSAKGTAATAGGPQHTKHDIDGPHYRLTEGGNAQRFVDLFAGRFRYVPEWGWLAYDGKRYQRGGEAAVSEAAKVVIKQLYDESGDMRGRADKLAAEHPDLIAQGNLDGRKAENKERRTAARKTLEWQLCMVAAEGAQNLSKWAEESDTAKGVRAILELARSDPRIAAKPEDFDRDIWALNVLNGTIDLKTGKLRSHQQSDLITKLASVTYDENSVTLQDAKYPRWEGFLTEIVPDRDLRDWWQRFLGYCLTGDVSEQCWAFALGDGSNGKNVIAEVFRGILGDYAGLAASDLLTLKRNESHPTGIADLAGKRFVVASEVDASKQWDETLIKRLTGDENMKGRYMQRDFFEFRMEAKLLALCNGRLKARDTSNGFWRRVNLVPFGVIIADDKVDKGLKEKLLEESSAILAWTVLGCLEWQRLKGLKPPKAITNLVAGYRGEQDMIGQWLSERCVCTCLPRLDDPDINPKDNDDEGPPEICNKCGAEVMTKKGWRDMPSNKLISPSDENRLNRSYEYRQDLMPDFEAWCRSRGETPWSWNSLRSELMKRGRIEHRTRLGRGLSGIRLRDNDPIPTIRANRGIGTYG